MSELMIESKPISSEPETVYVRLLVDDGNQFELVLPSDSPMLRDLVQVLVKRTHDRSGGKLFRIPIDNGASSVFLSSESLVAIATDPAIEVSEELEKINNPNLLEESLPGKLIESNFVLLDNFLDPMENQALIDYMLTHELAYSSKANERSLAESFASWRSILLNRIGDSIGEVLNQLGIPGFPLPTIEAAEFPNLNHAYKVDSDNSTPETSVRVLNFIYYFCAQSNGQSDGALRIYNSQRIGDRCQNLETFKLVEPRNNRIVFFFSRYSHEVLPVTSRTRAITQSCFKFNGWLRRPNSVERNQ